VPLDRLIDKEPRQFAYFHRLMGYSILSLILVIYTFTSTSASYQLYLLPLLLIYFLLCPRLEKWLQYKFDKKIEKNVLFGNEAVIIALVLAALHLSLVPTFTILFGLLYVGLNNKISLPVSCLIGLIGVIVFYFSTFVIFGAEEYFEPTNPELTVVSLLGLMMFIVIGNYYQHRRLNILGQQRQHYHNQMTRYIAFANQLSRYAPLQLWQSIMRGEAEANAI